MGQARACALGRPKYAYMTSFTAKELALPGVLLITPKLFPDSRGFFVETFHKEALAAAGITDVFVQDNLSLSRRGVVRGLHYQKTPHAQAKLVRCASGKIFDVVADHDPASATFGVSVSVELSGDTQAMLYVPGRYAHGFCAVSDEAIIEYKVSDYYAPECAGGVAYNSPLFAVQWPVTDPILSAQDKLWPVLSKI